MDISKQKLVIIDTGCANLASVRMAFERLGVQPQVSCQAADIEQADKLILPGVGTAVAVGRLGAMSGPLLAGKMLAARTRGTQSRQVIATIKHFAANDQETNRTNMVCTWANEQSIRETYLKPFEMSVKEGGAQAVMSSFNYIGYTYAGASNNLLNTVLRDEWGFKGFVLTDYFGGYGYQNADQEVRAGNDSMLATTKITNHITDKSATSVKAMRTAAHNILYTAANSWQYADGEPKVATPIWKTAMYVAWGVTAVLVIGLEIVAIKRYLNRKKAVATVESAAEPVAAGPANAE